jgi:hypothetical protein
MTSVAYSTASPCRPRRKHERACWTIGLRPIKPRGPGGFSSRDASRPRDLRAIHRDLTNPAVAHSSWSHKLPTIDADALTALRAELGRQPAAYRSSPNSQPHLQKRLSRSRPLAGVPMARVGVPRQVFDLDMERADETSPPAPQAAPHASRGTKSWDQTPPSVAASMIPASDPLVIKRDLHAVQSDRPAIINHQGGL